MFFLRKAGVLLAAVLTAIALPATAQELTIGLRSEPTSLDPQYQNIPVNNAIALHLFDALVARDEKLRAVPALALSWKPLSDTVWEFRLRPDVRFQDGSPFTAKDVVFTYERAAKVPNSPSPFTVLTRQMTRLEIVDPLTLRIATAAPAPLLPVDLAGLPILSHTAAAGGAPEGKTTAELDRGVGLVGTGPFKFVEWQRGGPLVLARNDDYWGPKPAWGQVTFRPLPDAAARVAALVAGSVDLIEDPPIADLPKLRKDPKVALAQAPSSRLIYIALDQFAEPSPGIPDTDGKNPLKDKRVRQALSEAINRGAIVEKVMDGAAQPAGDFLPWPAFGARKDAHPDRYDPAEARRLLAEAGYPKGFSITLGTPNGRYARDAQIAQAVADYWDHVGVKTGVEASEPSAFFKNRDEFKYSAYLAGWNAESGEISNPLRALVATPSREKGMGGNNRGRYSNPAVDAKLDEALRTVDDKAREALLQEASRLVLADHGILPIAFEMSLWAMRKGLAYAARADQMTLAQFVKPAK
ncbi:ABC transporter substrate-binding protein [Enhydrobacter sp.]|jgi:peptide/nickel transport system substrate-binding protein|uniref:ABC transporter substrate-binding protein n=1 Tax=Enhydrobacter sp. TaxID=1894999 RepID=UPI00260E8028|nr:ABC transporter substrate-binding protein [Enhydrobacter sp.]WIM11192.1 MAG: ABC transporter, substrate-binding protein (cluster 5, nickel/peptides/opines) [Enhydrobacter sp.]